MKISRIVLKAFIFVLTLPFFASCGGDITFPQGPTSSVDGLGFEFPQVRLRGQPDLSLETSYDTETKTFRFTWAQTKGFQCLTYEIILVPSPHVPPQDPTAVMTMNVLKRLGTTQEFALEVNADSSTYLQENTGRISAVLVCVAEELPFPRSELQNIGIFLP